MNANEPAFPHTQRLQSPTDHKYCDPGLTKREYFAAHALQGLASNHGMIDNMGIDGINWVSGKAIQLADTLLAELDRTEPKGAR